MTVTDIQHDAVAELYDERARNQEHNQTIAWRVAAVALAIAFLANAILGWNLYRDKRVIVPPLVLHDDGVMEQYHTDSEIRPTVRQKAIDGKISEYVFDRESYFYSYAGMKPRFDFVIALSSPDVAAIYKKWFFSGTADDPNPNSPQVYLGEKGQIDIQYGGMEARPRDGELVNVVRFKRIVIKNGTIIKQARCEAFVTYREVIIPDNAVMPDTKIPVRILNPFGIEVYRYQIEELSP